MSSAELTESALTLENTSGHDKVEDDDFKTIGAYLLENSEVFRELREVQETVRESFNIMLIFAFLHGFWLSLLG